MAIGQSSRGSLRRPPSRTVDPLDPTAIIEDAEKLPVLARNVSNLKRGLEAGSISPESGREFVQNVQDIEAGTVQPTGNAPVATPETATEPVADFDSRTPEDRARQQNEFRQLFNREEPPARQRLASLVKPPADGGGTKIDVRTAPTVVGPAQRAVAAAIDRTGADLPRPPAAPVPEQLDPVQPAPAIGMTVAEMRVATRNHAALQREAGRKLRDVIQPATAPQTPVNDRSLRTPQPDADESIAAQRGLRTATGEGGGLFASNPELITQAEAAERLQEVPQGEGFEPIRNLFRGLAAGGLGLGESTGTILRYLGGEFGLEGVAAMGESVEAFFQPRMRAFTERAHQTFRADQNIIENPELLLDLDFLTFSIGQIVPSLLATITPVGLARAAVRKVALSSVAKGAAGVAGAVGVAAEGQRAAITAQQAVGLGSKILKAEGFSAEAGTISRFVKIGNKAIDMADPDVMIKMMRIGKAATAAGYVAGGISGGALEGSSTYRETLDMLVEQGVPEDIARETAENAFLMMTAGSGVLNAVGLKALLASAPKLMSVEGVKARTIRGLVEGLTEYLEGPLEAGIQFGQGTITVEQAIQKIKDEANVLPAAILTGFFIPGAGSQLGTASDRTLPPAQEAAAATQEGEPGDLPPIDPGAGPAGQAVNVTTEEASATAQAEAEEVDETTTQEDDEGAATAAKPAAKPKAAKDTGSKPAPAAPDDEVVTGEDLVTEPEAQPEDEGDVEPEPTRAELAFDEENAEPTADDLLNARAALSTDEDGEFEISKQTVARLKVLADEFGVKKTGNKAAIVTRITDAAADLVAGRDTQESTNAQAIPDTEDQVQSGRSVTEGVSGEGGTDLQQPDGRAVGSEEADREGSEQRPAEAKPKVKPKPAAKKPVAKTAAKKTESVKPKNEKSSAPKISKKAEQKEAQRKAKAEEKKKPRAILTQQQLDKAVADPKRVLVEEDINLDVFTRDELADSVRFVGGTVRGNKTQLRKRLLNAQKRPGQKELFDASSVTDRISQVTAEPEGSAGGASVTDLAEHKKKVQQQHDKIINEIRTRVTDEIQDGITSSRIEKVDPESIHKIGDRFVSPGPATVAGKRMEGSVRLEIKKYDRVNDDGTVYYLVEQTFPDGSKGEVRLTNENLFNAEKLGGLEGVDSALLSAQGTVDSNSFAVKEDDTGVDIQIGGDGGGRVAYMGAIKRDDGTLQISSASVRGNEQGKGIGQKMIMKMHELSVRLGLPLVSDSTVSTDQLNAYLGLERKGWRIQFNNRALVTSLVSSSNRVKQTKFHHDFDGPVIVSISSPAQVEQTLIEEEKQREAFAKAKRVGADEVVVTQQAIDSNAEAVVGDQNAIDFGEQSGTPAPVSNEEIDRQAKEVRQSVTDESAPDQGTLFDASGKRSTGVGKARGTTKAGKIIGAAGHIKTPRQNDRENSNFVSNLDAENSQMLLTSEGTVKEIAKTGTKGPSQENLSSLFWYERAAGEVMRISRGSRKRADQLFRLLSLYSQANSVSSNTTAAINSLNEFLDGKESPAFGRFPKSTQHLIKPLLEAESMAVFIRNNEGELSEVEIVEGGLRGVGPKMISFYGNLHDAGFGEDTFANDSTIDRWMMRMFGYTADAPTAAQYAFAKQKMIDITEKFNAVHGSNFKPRQIQAAMWTQAKNDNAEIKLENKREAQGILARNSVNALLKQKRMTRAFIHEIADTFVVHLGGKDAVARLKQAPNKVILQTIKDKVVTLDFTKEFEPQVETFQESIQNATQLITAEVTPSADTAVGSTLQKSSPETQQKLLDDSLEVITDKKTGRDELADQVGVSLGFVEKQQGGFEGNVSPVVVTGVLPQGGATKGFSRDAVNLYSRAWQYLFRQKAVPWMRPVTKGKPKKADGHGRYFRFNRDLTELEIQDFMDSMGFHVHPDLGFTKVGEGEYVVVNFRTPDGKPAIVDPNTGTPLKDSVFDQGMTALNADVRARLGDGLDEFSNFRSEGEYHGNHNWQEDPEGKAIADDIIERGSPDLLKWLDSRRKVLDGINNRAAKAAGQDESFLSATSFRDRQEETPRSERRPVRAPVPLPRLIDTFGEAVEEILGRFGTFIGKNSQEQLKIYSLEDLAADPQQVLDQAAQHGFLVKFFSFEENAEAGVEFKLPRLTRDGYKQGTVWIYNPGNMAGSFKDKDYTLAWRVTHETAHGITEELMQQKYGDSKRYGRMGRTTQGVRGVAGKQVEVTLPPLTLMHAQRAVEWEEVTFRTQRLLLEELGVTITDEQFNMENRINMSDAMYRSLTGEFAEAGEAGFVPHDTPLDVKDVLIALEETENRLADFQSRDEDIGVELNTWQQIPTAKLKQLINRAKSNGKPNPTAQAAATGQSTTGAILAEADLRPSGQPSEVAASDRTASAAEGAAEQLSDPTADSVLFSGDSRLSTVTDPKSRGQKPKTPLTADVVRFHLLSIMNRISALINVRIVQSHSDLPAGLQLRMKKDQIDEIRGAYMPSTNTLYIVADSAVNLAGAERTILHEAFGHFAMSSLPTFAAIKARLQKLIDSNTDPVINQLVKDVQAKGHVSGDQFLDEVIAEMSETMTSRNAVMKEVIALVKEMVRALGFTVEMSNTDMMALIRTSRRRIERRALAAAGLGIDKTSDKYRDFLKSDNLTNLRKATNDQEIGIALERLAGEFDLVLFSASAPMNQELDDDWDRVMNTPLRELSWRDRLKKSMQRWHDLSFDELTQGLIDSANAVKIDEISLYGRLLDASVSSTKAMSTIRNMNNVMGAVMRHGIPALKENIINLVDGTKVRGLNFVSPKDGKAFQEIWTPLQQIGGESQLRNWEKWIVATRANRLVAEDVANNRTGKQRREKLIEQDLIDKTLQWAKNRTAENGKTYEEVFKEVQDNWQAVNKANLDLAEQAGVIDKAERKIWDQYDYVPFWREMAAMESGHSSGRSSRNDVSSAGLFRLTGGTDRDGSPNKLEGNVVDSMFMNTAYLLERSYKNEATRRTKDVGLQTGSFKKTPQEARPQRIPNIKTEDLITMLFNSGVINAESVEDAVAVYEALPKTEKDKWATFFNRVKPPGDDIVTVMEKGKPVYYEVTDRLMLRSIVGMQGKNIGMWMTAARTSKKWLTIGVTTDPAFMLANWMRDTVQTLIVSKAPLHSLADPITSLREAFNDSPAMLALAFAGRGGGGFYDTNPEKIRDLLKEMEVPGAEIDGFMRTIMSPKKLFRFWKRVGTASEFGNRVRVYNSLVRVWDTRIAELGQQGVTGQAAIDQAASEGVASPDEAAFQAQDLLNFTRSGDFTAIQNLIQIIPFLNARLQGLNKLWRGARENPLGFATKGGALMAVSLSIAIANDDDDRYNALPEWDKDTYYHFWIQGQHLRLPKPFESGVLFSTIPERIWRAGKGIDGWDEFSRSMLHAGLDTFAFNPIPQIAKPWMESYFNTNMFTSTPIIPAGMENLLPSRQYDWRTGEFARWVGDAMPDFMPDVMQSPKRIEHLMRGYFGAMGVYGMSVANVMTDSILHGPERAFGELNAMKLHEMPVVKRFVQADVPHTTKYNRNLWEVVREADGVSRTMKKYLEEGEGHKALGLARDEKALLALRPVLRRIATQVSGINRQINQISLDRRLSPERRAVLREKLLKQRNALTAQVEPLLEYL